MGNIKEKFCFKVFIIFICFFLFKDALAWRKLTKKRDAENVVQVNKNPERIAKQRKSKKSRRRPRKSSDKKQGLEKAQGKPVFSVADSANVQLIIDDQLGSRVMNEAVDKIKLEEAKKSILVENSGSVKSIEKENGVSTEKNPLVASKIKAVRVKDDVSKPIVPDVDNKRDVKVDGEVERFAEKFVDEIFESVELEVAEEKSLGQNLIDGDKILKLFPEKQQDEETYGYLGGFLRPWEFIEGEKNIEINFENARLINLIKFFEREYGVAFILDNVLVDVNDSSKSPAGQDITLLNTPFSFKTERAFTKEQAWNIFLAFLDMAGLNVVPGPAPRVYQITQASTVGVSAANFIANKEPVPIFIGTDLSMIPKNDMQIRYIYRFQNIDISALKNIVENMRSSISSGYIIVEDLNLLILNDKATNVHATLKVIKEIDYSVLPEKLIVLPLKKREAKVVKELCEGLSSQEVALLAGKPTAEGQIGTYFANVSFATDPRTNSIILLGARKSVDRVEKFIIDELDIDPEMPYSPFHVYRAKFINVEKIVALLQDLIKSDEKAGKVIGGVKFIGDVEIAQELSTNSIVINAAYEDYLQILELLEKIDVEQPQVAIRILVLDVKRQRDKIIGSQLRNSVPMLDGALGQGVNFQTSGLPLSSEDFSGVVLREHAKIPVGQNYGPTALLGDLINLASSNVVGSTLLTLGKDIFGVWGLFKLLQTTTDASVVAKPYLVASNKVTAHMEINSTRRIISSITETGEAPTRTNYTDDDAGLKIDITPIISSDGLITLDLEIDNSQFSGEPSAVSAEAGNKDKKEIKTRITISDNQVLALGGLSIKRTSETENRVPVLGSIPILGWLFKNKVQVVNNTSLLLLISVNIIKSENKDKIKEFTDSRIAAAKRSLEKSLYDNQLKDPITILFFNDDRDEVNHIRAIDEFVALEKSSNSSVVFKDADAENLYNGAKVEC